MATRSPVQFLSASMAALVLLSPAALGGCRASGGAAASSGAAVPAGSATGSAPSAVPAGYAEVTSTSAHITIALPADWKDISSYSATELIPLAEDLGTDDNKALKANLDAYEVFKTAGSAPGQPCSPRVYIDNERQENARMNVGDVFADAAKQDRVSIDAVEPIQTRNGQGIKGTFTNSPRSKADYGSVLYLPTSSADYARVFVFAISPDDAQKITEVIIATAH